MSRIKIDKDYLQMGITGVVFLLLVAVGLFFDRYWKKTHPSPPSTEEYIERIDSKIDSLRSEVNSLSIIRDSIDRRIDTVTVKIEETHIKYEKDRTTILNNTPGENHVFFLNYINSNRERLDSINNF